MYKLVLKTAFNVLLIHNKTFYLKGAADTFRTQNYPEFPGIEVWTGAEIDRYEGTKINIPIGEAANA